MLVEGPDRNPRLPPGSPLSPRAPAGSAVLLLATSQPAASTSQGHIDAQVLPSSSALLAEPRRRGSPFKAKGALGGVW